MGGELRPVSPAFALRLLHPKLTVVVVALKDDGSPNPMTAAWCMPTSARPPLIVVSIAPQRYTHQLILKRREFTVNILGVEHLDAVHICGTLSGRDTDKMKAAGLHAIPASKLRTPLIAEALAALECRLYKHVDAGDHTLFIGEVVAAHARPGVFDRRYNVERVRLIYHLGGDEYTTNAAEVLRPRAPT